MAIATVTTTINGVEHSLTYNETSGAWEATLTAPSKSSYNENDGHYYNVSIQAVDDAGNSSTCDSTHSTLGTSCQLKVKEKVAPTITILSPANGALLTNSSINVEFEVTDNDSGIDPYTLFMSMEGFSQQVPISQFNPTWTQIDGGYNMKINNLELQVQGELSLSIHVSDNDGNVATPATTTFTLDTIPPTLNVSSPADGLVTNQTNGQIVGTTNDDTSSPVTVTITVNGSDVGTVTVGSDGAFSKAVTYAEGVNTIVVTATDSAGKSTTITRTITINTVAPKFKTVELVPNPVDCGATYIIKVTFDE